MMKFSLKNKKNFGASPPFSAIAMAPCPKLCHHCIRALSKACTVHEKLKYSRCIRIPFVIISDLFPSPDEESRSSSLGSEGRQLRSRLVEFCNLCQKPVPTSSAAKTTASHVHCTCVTPPGAAVSEYSMALSPKKKKVESDIGGELSKRQLFREAQTTATTSTAGLATGSVTTSVVKMELVDPTKPSSSQSAAAAKASLPSSSAAGVTKRAEDETVAKRSEIKSRHPCTLCSKCFNTPGKLNQHMFSHTGEKPFVCSHCSKAFSSKFKLVRHILIHSDLRQYRCTVCDRTFHRKDHLKNHSKVHSPVKRRFKCDRADCTKEYSSILSYRKHIAVHSAEEGNLECKICSKRFETKEETLFHLKVHAGSRSLKTPADRKYHCDHCDRSFFTGKDVRRHLVVHTGRRDFLCQFCPQRFGRKDHLTRHIKKSHSNSAKKTKTRKQQTQQQAAGASTSGVSTRSSKSIDNILNEMFEEKTGVPSTSKQQPPAVLHEEGVPDDLYGMQGLDSPVDVMKLESSPDIIPIVTIDDKPPTQQQPPLKGEEDLSMYSVPILDTNIPFPKYDQYAFENYPYDEEGEPIPGPSSSSSAPAILPELMYQPHAHHQQPQPRSHPPPPYPVQLTSTTFGRVADDEGVVKVESDFAAERQSSSLDLVLPPIANISPSMSSCLLMSSEFQNLLSSAAAAAATSSAAGAVTAASEGGNVTADSGSGSNDTTADPLFNFLPSSGELLASLLSSSDPQTESAPLPGFNQAFHQPP